MAGPKGPELGTKSPYRIRVGIETQALRGVSKEGDSASGPPDTFQELINVDPSGGMWISRPGLARENSSQPETTGCCELIHELSDVGAPVESAFGACIVLLEKSGDPTLIRVFSDLTTPKLQTFTMAAVAGSDIPSAGVSYLSAVWSDNDQCVVAGSAYVDATTKKSYLARITLSDPPSVRMDSFLAGAGADDEIGITGLAADGSANPTLVHAGLGALTDATAMKIVTWNPDLAETAPVVVDGTMGTPVGSPIIAYFGNQVVVGCGKNRIRVDAVDQALPLGVGNFIAKAMVLYNGALHILGNSISPVDENGRILTWDGAALAIAADTGSATHTITHAVVFNGVLVYIWTQAGELTSVATWDGTTLNENVFAFDVIGPAKGLYLYNGRLIAILNDPVTGRKFYSSDGTNVASWSVETSIAGAPIDVGCVVGDSSSTGQWQGQLAIIDGKIHLRRPGQTEWDPETSLPAGVRLKANRPFVTKARKGSLILTIINGRYSPGLVFVQGVPYKLGITAPTSAPTLATQSTGLTGDTIGYYSFVHKTLFRGSWIDVHESTLSPSATITLANQGVKWTLPATAEARVTHIRLYRVPISGGTLPRKVADVAIGTTTYNEAVTDAVLLSSTTPPTTLDSDGQVVLDNTARGIPPYGLGCWSYNSRVWYGPDPNYPARMWKSRLNEPESVDLSTGYVETQTGDAITAAGATENELVIFSAFGGFGLEGFSDTGDGDAIRMRKMDNSLGCVGLYSVKNVQGSLVFLSPQGPAIYPGWRVLIHKSLRSWFDTEYLANPRAYQLAYSYTSSQKGVYSLYVIKDASPRTYVWNWFYRPMVHDGQEPDYWWYFHKYGRVISTVGDLYDPNLMRPVTHYGTCEGYVMVEDTTNANDTGDTYSKALTITPRHFFPGDQGGDDAHGASWQTAELYLKNETIDVTLSAYAGDDTATLAASPQKTVVLKAAQETRAGRTAVPRTSRAETLDISGKGITISLTASSPVGIEFRGFGLLWKEGEQDRPLQ